MMEVFLSRENLAKLIAAWARSMRVYVPVTFDIMNHETTPDYELVGDEVPKRMELHGAAPAHSPKSFIFYAREVVSKYPTANGAAEVEAPPTVIVGPRGCDLRALQKFDKVYWSTAHHTEEYDDAFVIEKRKHTFIVSVDCTAAKETCFCTMVGGEPYAKEGFDLNLSPVEGGCILTVASERGEALLTDKALSLPQGLTTPVSQDQLAERGRNRSSVTEAVNRQNAERRVDVPYDRLDLEGTRESWAYVTQNCVACGACNRCCPSCTCFLLVDQRTADGFERIRDWDTCLSIGFARTAGANSRPNLPDRLENRIRCKYEYSRDRYGIVTCTGCGRCIDVCMGRIDMRDAVKRVALEKAKAGA